MLKWPAPLGGGWDSDEGLGAREGGAGAGNVSDWEAWSLISGTLSQRDIGVQLIHIKPHIVPGAVGTVVTFGIWLTERWGPGGGQGALPPVGGCTDDL